MKKYMAKKGKKHFAQEGLINPGAGQEQQPQGQPVPQQGQPPNGGQPQGGGKSIDVSLTLNDGQGQPQPLGNMSIKSPDDVKKLIQMIVQAMGQGQPQGGEQPQGQPQQ